MIIYSDAELTIETLDDHHVKPLFRLIDENRAYLKTWLTWVDHMPTEEHFSNYVQGAKNKYNNGIEVSCAIVMNNSIAGRIGLYSIDQWNKTASIGYWLGEAHQGKGIATKACKAMIRYGFTELGLNRIEIKCATENYKSQEIPERLGFCREGIVRAGEFVNDRFIDLYLYSILKEEWKS